MVDVILYFDCILCVLDLVTISAIRRFLFDFLIDCKNRKSANKFHAQQSLSQRITLCYIQQALKKNVRIFRRYQKLYTIILITLFPQYIILFICNITMGIKSLNVLILFALIKLFIAITIRFQTDSNLMSKYRKR